MGVGAEAAADRLEVDWGMAWQGRKLRTQLDAEERSIEGGIGA